MKQIPLTAQCLANPRLLAHCMCFRMAHCRRLRWKLHKLLVSWQPAMSCIHLGPAHLHSGQRALRLRIYEARRYHDATVDAIREMAESWTNKHFSADKSNSWHPAGATSWPFISYITHDSNAGTRLQHQIPPWGRLRGTLCSIPGCPIRGESSGLFVGYRDCQSITHWLKTCFCCFHDELYSF